MPSAARLRQGGPGTGRRQTSVSHLSPAEGTITDLRERNRVDNRAATVDAAFALFAERGYCHVTVADICAAAGIGRRTFFRYFATKDDVLTEPACEMTARVVAAIAAAPADMSEPQALRHALTETAAYALTHRARLHQLAEVRRTSADIRWSPLTRLPEQEQRLARQLAARRGSDAAPGWPTRLLVARAVAACASGSTTSSPATAPIPGSICTRSSTPNRSPHPPRHRRKQRPLSTGLQGYAGQLGAIPEQLVLDLGVAGGRVCRAGPLVIEIAARHPGVRIRADGQPGLGHRGE